MTKAKTPEQKAAKAANVVHPQEAVRNVMRGTETAGKPPESFYSPATGIDAARVNEQTRAQPQPAAQPAHSGLEALRVEEASNITADARLAHVEENREASEDGRERLRTEREQYEEDVARVRASRKPFGAFTQKLALPERSGYKRHWFSDEPGRVDEALSSGWAHVKDSEGKPVCRVVGSSRQGGPLLGYAMEIPKIFWDEDMEAKHKEAQDRLDAIKKEPFRAKPGQSNKSDAGKFYSPKDDVLSVQTPHR